MKASLTQFFWRLLGRRAISYQAPVMWVNSADDFINPPELGIAEVQVKNIPHATFVLIPTSDQTHGHGTHTWAAVWQDKLAALLKETEH